jgi:hypothetical protein
MELKIVTNRGRARKLNFPKPDSLSLSNDSFDSVMVKVNLLPAHLRWIVGSQFLSRINYSTSSYENGGLIFKDFLFAKLVFEVRCLKEF